MVPFKYAAAFMRADIKVEIRTLHKGFFPSVPIKIHRPVFIAVFIAVQHAVGAFLGIDQVGIGNRPYISKVDAAEDAVPVRTVALRLPEIVHPAHIGINFLRLVDFFCTSSIFLCMRLISGYLTMKLRQ